MHSLTKLTAISNTIRSYSSLFDPRSFYSFQSVLEVLLQYTNCKQPEFAAKANKSLSAIQYFFRYAKWNSDTVNSIRLVMLRNRRPTQDRKTDILICDGSPIAKDKACKSAGISTIWDNRKKTVVAGYELLGTAVMTKTGSTYPLRLMLFVPTLWLSEWHAWKKLLRWCFKRSKAWLVVVDRGFRNSFFLALILRNKRDFLVRATVTMPVWVLVKRKREKKRGRKKRFSNREKKTVNQYCTTEAVMKTSKGRLWLLSNVVIDAWKNEVTRCCSVIVYHQNGFKDPLVIVFSRKNITMEQALEIVGVYHNRWKIETCFLELKTMFQMEKFQLTSVAAIEKWIIICLVAHSILQGKHVDIRPDSLLATFIRNVLQKHRNIKERTILNLKIFLEMCQSNLYGLHRRFSLLLAKYTPCKS